MDQDIAEITASHDTGNYPVKIGKGILAEALLSAAKLFRDPAAVIVSSRVFDLHENAIIESLSGLSEYEIIKFDDSEKNKSYAYAEKILEAFIRSGISRRSGVIGIGGGVTGDFAGFLAGTYMRGIPLIHVPTTLLAMVDSSIGGKVAVNLSVGKNIVGVFHQPSMVIADLDFLTSLPYHEMANGITEAFKHGLLGDMETLEILKQNNQSSINDASTLNKLVRRSVAFKASIVERDNKESGLRAVLNYGHTVGHALESITEHAGVSHGQAVAYGMLVKSGAGLAAGMLRKEEVNLIRDIIYKYCLIKEIPKINIDELITHMVFDKKTEARQPKFVLLDGIGKPVWNKTIDEDLLKAECHKALTVGSGAQC
jgi:3-dehydroquinate synthase